MNAKKLYLRWGPILALIHLSLVLFVNADHLSEIVSSDTTIAPSVIVEMARKWQPTDPSKSLTPLEQVQDLYSSLTGIDRNYGYFAPNVPGGFEMRFEFTNDKHEVINLTPPYGLKNKEEEIRMATIFGRVFHAKNDTEQEYLIRRLVIFFWNRQSSVTHVRAILFLKVAPSPSEFRMGKKFAEKIVCAYDY